MSYTYTVIDGQRVEVNVAVAFRKLAAAFKAKFGLELLVTSGTRTRAEQQYLYNGWINRLPGFNLAAAPGWSNHEESGPIGPRALDVRDSGSDAGVTVYGSVRAKWLRANASKYGFDPAGYNPNWSQIEPWHIEFSGRIGGRAPEKSSLSPGLAWPFSWYTVKKGDTLIGIARDHHMSLSRLKRLNGSINDPTKLQIGARLRVALDQVPIKPKIDNIPGPETYGALEQAMGRTVDKRFGRDDVRALQRTMNKKRKVPVQVTGTLNDETMDALASWVAAPRSQVWAKVQKQLANGTGVWR